jgi:hypothetical protein
MEEFDSPTPIVYCTGNSGGDFIPRRPPTTDASEWNEKGEIEQGELRMYKIMLRHRYGQKILPPTSGTEFGRALCGRAYELLSDPTAVERGSMFLKNMRHETLRALRERQEWMFEERQTALQERANPFVYTLNLGTAKRSRELSPRRVEEQSDTKRPRATM